MGGRVRLVSSMLLLLVAVSCGASGGAVSGGQLYTVTTMVMQKPGEAPHACAAAPLPYPPIGCGGPDVRGLDLATLPGVVLYVNGVRVSRTLRLVGTWDAGTLVLTRRPTAVDPARSTQIHVCQQPNGFTANGDTPPMMQRLMADTELLRSRGIMLLEFGPCDESTYFTVVPVADADTVQFLADRYGPTLRIYGWMEPVD